jgi:transcriptional regulator with XRE-family HTH domain
MEPEEILELLELTGWTREELAKKLGLSGRNTVDRWFVAPAEQRRYPSEEFANKMAAWLDEARDKKISELMKARKEAREESRKQPA